MPLILVRNDITKMTTDAIVNATDANFSGNGGTDAAIHLTAGPKLAEQCRKLHPLSMGEAALTKGYLLPSKYIIHTLGPTWHGGEHGEADVLYQCYQSCLRLASRHRCKSISFPLISAGTYGYPKEDALRIATESINAFLRTHEMTVYLVVYDKTVYQISKTLYKDVQAYIDDCYAKSNHRTVTERERFTDDSVVFQSMPMDLINMAPLAAPSAKTASVSKQAKFNKKDMEKALAVLDESFSQMLLRKIDESGMKDSECYKKANIDRKLFSKIRSDVHYKPSKSTVLAFAIALQLPLAETEEMLKKAGFALSHSNKFDVIVEYFIKNENYDIHTINQTLFEFDQNLLGN